MENIFLLTIKDEVEIAYQVASSSRDKLNNEIQSFLIDRGYEVEEGEDDHEMYETIIDTLNDRCVCDDYEGETDLTFEIVEVGVV
ncbi:MAG: hypothetical protein K2H20_04130 [Bacilli bacterium]|nr:hypothetical protein [Bacilli bacterium]